jgi:hypothetical protein
VQRPASVDTGSDLQEHDPQGVEQKKSGLCATVRRATRRSRHGRA